MRQTREPGNWLRCFPVIRFLLQCGFEKVFFFGRNPFRLARMVADAEPPDRQKQKRQQPFEHEHWPPAIRAEQPAGDRRGTGDGERLAEQPTVVGPGAFGAREPVRQQHQRRRENRALRHSEKKSHHLKLPEALRQAAADGAQSPRDEAQADEFARAPPRCPVTAGHLQQNIAEKENARRLALHFVIHQQVAQH